MPALLRNDWRLDRCALQIFCSGNETELPVDARLGQTCIRVFRFQELVNCFGDRRQARGREKDCMRC